MIIATRKYIFQKKNKNIVSAICNHRACENSKVELSLCFTESPSSRSTLICFRQIKIPRTRRVLVGRKMFQTILCYSNGPCPCRRFVAQTFPDTVFSRKNALSDRLSSADCSALCTRYLPYFGRYRSSSKWIPGSVSFRNIVEREAIRCKSSTESCVSNSSYRRVSDVCPWLCWDFARTTSPLLSIRFCWIRTIAVPCSRKKTFENNTNKTVVLNFKTLHTKVW